MPSRAARRAMDQPLNEDAQMENSEAHGHVVSDTPGRLRIRLRRAHRHPEIMERARAHLAQQDAIHGVSTNGSTGSVMVKYDPGRSSRDAVLAMLQDIGIIVRAAAEEVLLEPPGESGHSTTAISLIAAVNDLDRRLSRSTGRKVDLKLLFPMGLLALALRQAATQGLGLSMVPAYVLLWYAFDSFWKFHQGGVAASQEKQDLHAASGQEHELGQSGSAGNEPAPRAA